MLHVHIHVQCAWSHNTVWWVQSGTVAFTSSCREREHTLLLSCLAGALPLATLKSSPQGWQCIYCKGFQFLYMLELTWLHHYWWHQGAITLSTRSPRPPPSVFWILQVCKYWRWEQGYDIYMFLTCHPPHFRFHFDGLKGSCSFTNLPLSFVRWQISHDARYSPHFPCHVRPVETRRNLVVCLISSKVTTCKTSTKVNFDALVHVVPTAE